jgi:bifunctional non-homologous end joining protein LigD
MRPSTRSRRESLKEYRAKRRFERTPEPAGKRDRDAAGARAQTLSFVIQKHAARSLHYDFRLELDGVLLSWSVPKGPSLSTKEKRLAMRTEDHPIEYAGFEGVIPEGEYGAGAVVVWDRGGWIPEGDAKEGLARGRLTFELRGHKLRGKWHLVRTRPQRNREAWLLIKSHDERASDERDIVADRPRSVLSRRTIEQVAKQRDRIWRSNRKQDGGRNARGPDLHATLRSLPLSYQLTNLDKVLYPENSLTKGELIAYLAVVRDWILPHVAGRPLTLVRCPEGRHKQCFFQKHANKGVPEAVKRIPIEENGATETYMLVDELDGLLALAQLGALELHTWGCHYERLERPDVLVFDLDPAPELAWDVVVSAAFALRERLRAIGLESLVKTTGGKGLHVVAPVAPRLDWEAFKSFAKAVVVEMERAEPSRYTTNPRKAHRRGKVFLDYLRNGRGATFIAPYSVRAREYATVATPITWEELEKGVDPARFTVATIPRRLATLKRDPWIDYGKLAQQAIRLNARRPAGEPPRITSGRAQRPSESRRRARASSPGRPASASRRASSRR